MAVDTQMPKQEQEERDETEETEFDISNLTCPRTDEVDASRVVMMYDRFSDTLLVHLYGKGVPSVSVPVQKYYYALVSLDGRKILGFQVEGFLAQAIKDQPSLIEMLNFAELRGITPAEVQEIRNDTLHPRMKLSAGLRWMFIRNLAERRQQTLKAFLEQEEDDLRLHAVAC